MPRLSQARPPQAPWTVRVVRAPRGGGENGLSRLQAAPCHVCPRGCAQKVTRLLMDTSLWGAVGLLSHQSCTGTAGHVSFQRLCGLHPYGEGHPFDRMKSSLLVLPRVPASALWRPQRSLPSSPADTGSWLTPLVPELHDHLYGDSQSSPPQPPDASTSARLQVNPVNPSQTCITVRISHPSKRPQSVLPTAECDKPGGRILPRAGGDPGTGGNAAWHGVRANQATISCEAGLSRSHRLRNLHVDTYSGFMQNRQTLGTQMPFRWQSGKHT